MRQVSWLQLQGLIQQTLFFGSQNLTDSLLVILLPSYILLGVKFSHSPKLIWQAHSQFQVDHNRLLCQLRKPLLFPENPSLLPNFRHQTADTLTQIPMTTVFQHLSALPLNRLIRMAALFLKLLKLHIL